MSIVLALGISSVGKVLQSKGDSLSEEHMDKVRTALERYKAGNGRYPCPAPLNVAISDAIFGREAQITTSAGNACYRSPSAAYDNAQTLGKEGFVRFFDAGAATDAQKWNKSVIIGAIPVQELGIDKKYATDKWGNKLVYAVTEKLAADTSGSTPSALDNATPYSPTPPSLPVLGATGGADKLGAIIIIDTAGNSVAANADYVVVSSGSDGNGSFNANATAQSACVTTAGAVGILEKENCDFADTTKNNIFTASGTYNKSENANYFFDLVRWDSFTSSDVNITGSTTIKNNLTIDGSSLASGQNALVVRNGGADVEDGSGASLVTVDNTATAINNALDVNNTANFDGALTSNQGATFSGSGVNSNTLGVSGNSTLATLSSTDANIRITSSGTCGAGNYGRVRFNSTANTIEYCNNSGTCSDLKRPTGATGATGGTNVYLHSCYRHNGSSPFWSEEVCPRGYVQTGTNLIAPSNLKIHCCKIGVY